MAWFRVGLVSIVICGLTLGVGSTLRGVTAAPLDQQDLALITSPQSNAQIAGMVQVIGSAAHPEFQRYELAWADEPNTTDTWMVFATIETPIQDGVLGIWNTLQAPDGLYSLRLRVVRRDGNYGEVIVRGVRVANSQPLESPTPAVAPTIPPEPSQVPVVTTVTPELIVQPPTSTPAPPTATPTTDQEESTVDTLSRLNPASFSLNLDALQQACCNGAVYTFAAFLLWGAVLGARAIARFGLRHLARRTTTSQQDE
ncbi:MAG: hypothetical protein JW850_04915 [Thermoflexales bacterium]|nr:hypothetical protein [Thermoflexales bacterium]